MISLSSKLLTLTILLPAISQATQPQILGTFDEGQSAPPVQAPADPGFTKLRETKLTKNGRKVEITEVEAPELVEELPPAAHTAQPVQSTPTPLVDGGTFILKAQAFHPRGTLLTWHLSTQPATQAQSAWSNLNPAHLQGFSCFSAEGKKFTFMLLPSSTSLADLRNQQAAGGEVQIPQFPDQLPRIGATGTRLIPISKLNTDLQAKEFIIQLHRLYRQQKERLIAAHDKRVAAKPIREARRKQREAEERKKPLKLTFWNNQPNLEKQK